MYKLRPQYTTCKKCSQKSTLHCKECQLVTYCSDKCRKEHLEEHKATCKGLKEDREQAEKIVQALSGTYCQHLLSLLNGLALRNNWNKYNAFGIMVCDSKTAEFITGDPLAFCIRIFSVQAEGAPRNKDIRVVFPAGDGCKLQFIIPYDAELDTPEQKNDFNAIAKEMDIDESFFNTTDKEVAYYMQKGRVITVQVDGEDNMTRLKAMELLAQEDVAQEEVAQEEATEDGMNDK